MKKYLSLFLICLSLLLVSCGQGKPKDFDIKLDSVDPEDLIEDVEEMFEELEDNPISGNASWYNVNISGYYNEEREEFDETSNTKYSVTGTVYVGKTLWDTKAHLVCKATNITTEDGDTEENTYTSDIVWLEGTAYVKNVEQSKSENTKSKDTTYTRSFTLNLGFQGSQFIYALSDPSDLFEVLISTARAQEIDDDNAEVYRKDNKYGYTTNLTQEFGSYESESEAKCQFDYDAKKNLIKSIDYYTKYSSESEDSSTEYSYSVQIDKALFGIIIKPLNHADYIEE